MASSTASLDSSDKVAQAGASLVLQHPNGSQVTVVQSRLSSQITTAAEHADPLTLLLYCRFTWLELLMYLERC